MGGVRQLSEPTAAPQPFCGVLSMLEGLGASSLGGEGGLTARRAMVACSVMHFASVSETQEKLGVAYLRDRAGDG